ncbi:MAG: dihydroneopterin aldolase [Sphingobacteriales bacterium]|nr:dihydroneopterin aldolase [Sphingobacteriales bacterium]
MVKISLHNLLFFAHHGLHEEEKILGGDFEVNADLYYENRSDVIKTIEDTIDYGGVYAIIKQRMNKPTPLLETIAMEMAVTIKQAFPVTNELSIRIKKINPPITAFAGNVEVCYIKKYN